FFQAEDGIRDRNVTGVQTCALPIWRRSRVGSGATGDRDRADDLPAERLRLRDRGRRFRRRRARRKTCRRVERLSAAGQRRLSRRSEERRVGKEEGTRGWG